ncbi:hypothetical protein E8E13_004042 [Curvularia kusanoi]|uniref:Uncharacterized protein n=1 Tax=Curvularia kusanoi TaxID=90978 RepID=A0A9P4T8T5_CURKU|nr:hypothetical protein E8E13_004042 [Curvularia kusanoi]
MSRSKSVPRLKHITGDIQPLRHWSTFEQFYPGNANNITGIQVRDYMPPLYWAGRFQSQFDQWRTEAMRAMLHPDVIPEEEGPLGECRLGDEKKATILIFMQLRDLCSSAQAANSLHEFEYKYRKDHKMLDTAFDLPPSLRKLENHANEGPVGRAVRKLTPRKASFVNLFKGKGWNRSDETGGLEAAEHLRELKEMTDQLSGLEPTDSTTYKSGVLQHAH